MGRCGGAVRQNRRVPSPSRRLPLTSRVPRRRGLLAAALVAVLAGAGLAGCGNDRTPVPEIGQPGPRLGDNPVKDAEAGLSLIAPAGWTVTPGQDPLVTTIADGSFIVGIFRYPRTEPLPTKRDELDRAMNDLIAAAKARDATFEPLATARTKVDGKPAIQIRGTQTIGGQPRTVRSTHVFAYGAELVIDQFAPNDVFRQVDEATFRPLLRSIELEKPAA